MNSTQGRSGNCSGPACLMAGPRLGFTVSFPSGVPASYFQVFVFFGAE